MPSTIKPTVTPTPLAPFPGTRTRDTGDPFIPPVAREGEVPPLMITQDVSSPGRTISTNYDPADQLEPVVPPGGSLPGGETPVTATVAISASDIAALSTTPKELVPAPATGASLEFQSATGTYTYGTTTYTGTGMLHIKCGETVVSDDVPTTILTGAVSGPIAFTALPGITLAPDLPLTLSLSGGSLIGGDGTLSLDVVTSTHLPPPPTTLSATGQTAPPPATLSSPSETRATVGHSLYTRKNR